jgi:outer membrane protein assembly factor BamA
MFFRGVVFLLLAAWAGPAVAQQSSPPASRSEALERERDQKSADLKPEVLTGPEKALRRVQDERYLERFMEGYKGWRPAIGSMATGSGFAFGANWHSEELLKGYMFGNFEAATSTRLWQKYAGSLTFPHLFGQRLAAGVSSSYRNYNSLDYYGPGLNSDRNGRSNYRLEDTGIQGAAVLRPERRLKLGFGTGYLWTNVGPGKRDDVGSTDKIYNERQAPGVQIQSNFLRSGLFTQYDYRDNPLGPKTGGNYVFQMTWYKDLDRSLYSFRRFDFDLQQYVGLFNNLRRFAFRARGIFTERESGQREVPFYLRPTVGGSDDLRGFRNYRFNDRNALVLNAEYRWEIFSGLDGALFFDAGKVMPKGTHLGLGNMKGSAGFGFRGNVRNQTIIRVDVGFSREGFMIWFKFNDAFNSQRFGTGVGQPVY